MASLKISSEKITVKNVSIACASLATLALLYKLLIAGGGSSNSSGTIPIATDERDKILNLLSSVVSGLPESWQRADPISQWIGVATDDDGNVVEIVAKSTHMRGAINNSAMQQLDHLFPKLRILDLADHELTGPCSLDHLPPGLIRLELRRHLDTGKFLAGGTIVVGMTGALNVSKLPHSLRSLGLQSNRFSGEIDWAAFRHIDELLHLSLHVNDFSGPIAFDALPRSLQTLNIGSNRFSGPVNLNDLPRSLTNLSLFLLPRVHMFADIDKPFPLLSDANSKALLASLHISLGDPNGPQIPGDAFLEAVSARARQKLEYVLQPPVAIQQQQQQQQHDAEKERLQQEVRDLKEQLARLAETISDGSGSSSSGAQSSRPETKEIVQQAAVRARDLLAEAAYVPVTARDAAVSETSDDSRQTTASELQRRAVRRKHNAVQEEIANRIYESGPGVFVGRAPSSTASAGAGSSDPARSDFNSEAAIASSAQEQEGQ